MEMYRLYYLENDGKKMYLCYSVGIGSHFSGSPADCSIHTLEQAGKRAEWQSEFCANVDGKCLFEPYEENRAISVHEKKGTYLATEWVRYEHDYIYWNPVA